MAASNVFQPANDQPKTGNIFGLWFPFNLAIDDLKIPNRKIEKT